MENSSNPEHQSLIATARQELQNMRATLGRAGDGERIEMTVVQFRKLARLIHSLSSAIPEPEPDSFRDPRHWVPLDQFASLRKNARRLSSELEQLRTRDDFGNLLR